MKTIRISLITVIIPLFLVGIVAGIVRYEEGLVIRESDIQKIIVRCNALGQNARYIFCLRTQFRPYVRPQNLTALMSAIEKATSLTVTSKDSSTTTCHDIGHIVGELAVASYPNPGKLISLCGRSCGYGCAHGVMQGLLRQNPSSINSVQSLCLPQNSGVVDRTDSISCNHGVGHGIADYFSYDFAKSLAWCDRFPTDDGKNECATGVVMEIFDAPTYTHPTAPVPTDILSYCRRVPAFFYNLCINDLASKHYRETTSIELGYAICRTQTGKERADCASSIGSDVYFVYAGRVPDLVDGCSSDPEFLMSCIDGALTSSLVIDGTGLTGQEICQRLPAGDRGACVSDLQKQYDDMRATMPL